MQKKLIAILALAIFSIVSTPLSAGCIECMSWLKNIFKRNNNVAQSTVTLTKPHFKNLNITIPENNPVSQVPTLPKPGELEKIAQKKSFTLELPSTPHPNIDSPAHYSENVDALCNNNNLARNIKSQPVHFTFDDPPKNIPGSVDE